MVTATAAPPLQRDASKLSLEALIHLYELSNTADGKSRKTIRGYTELLSSFVAYLKAGEVDTVITAFTSDMVCDYKLYLLERHKYAGASFHAGAAKNAFSEGGAMPRAGTESVFLLAS